MKNGLFEKGDKIKGTNAADKHYGITNTDMSEGIVIIAKTNNNNMLIKITKHRYREEVGKTYSVANDSTHFELVEEKEKDFWEDLEVL